MAIFLVSVLTTHVQDECHATGFMGKSGRGTDEHFGMLGEVDIVNSTLGKAMGGATGACRNMCKCRNVVHHDVAALAAW